MLWVLKYRLLRGKTKSKGTFGLIFTRNDRKAAHRVKKLELNNNTLVPSLGMGTWLTPPGKLEELVKHAIDIGYRHIDGAMMYGNEKEIGDAIKSKIESGAVRRERIFLVDKLWNTFHEEEKVLPACRKSLDNFGLGVIDLYLMEWPIAQKETAINPQNPFGNAVGLDYDYVKTWKGMEMCVKQKLVRSIGLSNFNSRQIRRILEVAVIKPVMNQIEVHPHLDQHKLIQFCKDLEIQVTAYSPFGSPNLPWAEAGDLKIDFKDPRLVKIAEKYKKTTHQVVLRYLLDLGTIPIPKSENVEQLKENFDVFSFALTREEVNIINGFEKKGRIYNPRELRKLPNYPFNEEF